MRLSTYFAIMLPTQVSVDSQARMSSTPGSITLYPRPLHPFSPVDSARKSFERGEEIALANLGPATEDPTANASAQGSPRVFKSPDDTTPGSSRISQWAVHTQFILPLLISTP